MIYKNLNEMTKIGIIDIYDITGAKYQQDVLILLITQYPDNTTLKTINKRLLETIKIITEDTTENCLNNINNHTKNFKIACDTLLHINSFLSYFKKNIENVVDKDKLNDLTSFIWENILYRFSAIEPVTIVGTKNNDS